MSKPVNYLLWMAGSAWLSAGAAGLAVVLSVSAFLRWLLVFTSVFNGLFAIFWAMMSVTERMRSPSNE